MSYLCEAFKVKYLKQIGNDEILQTMNYDRRKFTKVMFVKSFTTLMLNKEICVTDKCLYILWIHVSLRKFDH